MSTKKKPAPALKAATVIKGTATGKPKAVKAPPPRQAGTAQAKAAETVTIERCELEQLNNLLARRTEEFNASQKEAAELRRRLSDIEATLLNLSGAMDIAVRRVWVDRDHWASALGGTKATDGHPF